MGDGEERGSLGEEGGGRVGKQEEEEGSWEQGSSSCPPLPPYSLRSKQKQNRISTGVFVGGADRGHLHVIAL